MGFNSNNRIKETNQGNLEVYKVLIYPLRINPQCFAQSKALNQPEILF